jgi:hypothetical protein
MKKVMIASACILALSTGGAFAQMQPAPGASSEGNVGPGATGTTKHMNTSKHHGKHMNKGTTTGMGSAHSKSTSPSSSGSKNY